MLKWSKCVHKLCFVNISLGRDIIQDHLMGINTGFAHSFVVIEHAIVYYLMLYYDFIWGGGGGVVGGAQLSLSPPPPPPPQRLNFPTKIG